MKGKIADSIIIKVGHGIMEIPRNTKQEPENETFYSKPKSTEPERNSQRKPKGDTHHNRR